MDRAINPLEADLLVETSRHSEDGPVTKRGAIGSHSKPALAVGAAVVAFNGLLASVLMVYSVHPALPH